MQSIDLNADLGEYRNAETKRCEEEILKYITSCNISCGGHIGDEKSIRATIKSAIAQNVKIGAHPSYPDREGFGRRPLNIDLEDLEQSLVEQLTFFKSIAEESGLQHFHVKAHGALYNEAMCNPVISACLLRAIDQVCPTAQIVGMPGSALEKMVTETAHQFIAEGFADRRYAVDGFLVSRTEKGSIIATVSERVEQAIRLSLGDDIKSAKGTLISMKVETLCLHGDDRSAVETAKTVHSGLRKANIDIKAYE